MYNVYINFDTDGDLSYELCPFEKRISSYTNRTNVFCKTLDDAYKIVEEFIDNIIKQTDYNPKYDDYSITFGAIREELYGTFIQYVRFHDSSKLGDYISIYEEIGNMELDILIIPQEIEVWYKNNKGEYVKDEMSNVRKPDTTLCDFCSYCRQKLYDRKE